MRLCWTADTITLTCLRFGFGCAGAAVSVVVVSVVVVCSLSPVKEDMAETLAATSMSRMVTSRQSVICFALKRRSIIRWMVSLAMSCFENPAKIMACGTLTPVVVSRIRTADSTFFCCAALFFGMLGNCVYSVGTE